MRTKQKQRNNNQWHTTACTQGRHSESRGEKIEEGALTRGLEVVGWKTKELSISRQMELARQNIKLEEIREIGRGLVVQCCKGRKNNFVLNMGFDRKPA